MATRLLPKKFRGSIIYLPTMYKVFAEDHLLYIYRERKKRKPRKETVMPINTVNDVDDLAMKGIVAVPLRFRKRSSGKISYTPGECRKWHPLMTGDYGPKDDDD